MNDTRDKLPVEGDLPIERVERVGDYFRNLFVRSLKLGLEDGALERSWEALSAPPERSRSPAAIETGSRQPGAGPASDQGAGESEEEETA